MSSPKYSWKGPSLPDIDNHSINKHEILSAYIIEYIQVRYSKILKYPSSSLNLTIVDGFAGGGRYNYKDSIKEGSPLVIARAVMAADAALKTMHGTERIKIKVDILCIEKDVDAVESLKNSFSNSDFEYTLGKIDIWQKDFEKILPKVLKFIQQEGHKKRKCLFFLDQYGYKNVLLYQIQQILTMNSEIIMTFAIDSLITFFSEKNHSSLLKIGFSQLDINHLLALRKSSSCRSEIQHILSNHLRRYSGAPYYTPFLIHSDKGNWGYWLVHLSKHQKARAVMSGIHWKYGNKLAHYGKAGLNMLAYDSKSDVAYTGQHFLGSVFRFDEEAKSRVMSTLLQDIMSELSGECLKVSALKEKIANGTPASDDMINNALWIGVEEKEILLPRRKKENIQDSDYIEIARQRTLFSFPSK